MKIRFLWIVGVLVLGGYLLFKGCSRDQVQKKSQISQESISVQDREHKEAPIDAQKNPSTELLKLLDVMGVQHDGSLQSIMQATQKAWLRQAGKERWQIGDQFAQKRDIVMPLLTNMGFVHEQKVTQNQYDYALVLGATMQRMRSRVAYLLKQVTAGIHVGKIIVLTGLRDRSNDIETESVILGTTQTDLPIKKDWHLTGALPATETDMIKLIFEQTDFPDVFKSIPVEFINTPVQMAKDGTLRRPNTADTVHAWLATSPVPGSCLAVSNQPYNLYQDTIIRNSLPSTFMLETVGAGVDISEKAQKQENIAVFLDTLARYIFAKTQQ